MKLLVATGKDMFFGQSRKPWVSLNTQRFLSCLADIGIDCEAWDIHRLAHQAASTEGCDIFYTFSQREHLRHYIATVMLQLSRHNRIIPSAGLLLSHENKGWAELLRKKLGILEPKSWFLSDAANWEELDLSWPLVLKTTSGTNSRGVWLCRDKDELSRRIRMLSQPLTLRQRLDFLRRLYLRKGRSYPGYPDFEPAADARQWLEYMTPGACFVLQEFIPGLDCDYRVIAVQERFYTMKRLTGKGDFRASGTKKFVFDFTPPDGLLDYARDTWKRFDTPFLAMDIGHADGRNYLFEFQASHFGTSAIVLSHGCYEFSGAGWSFVPGSSNLEETLAHGLASYLGKEA